MKKDHTLKVICTLYFSLCAFYSNAQKTSTLNSLQQIISSVDSFNVKLPAEQLYIHFDKKNFAIGDTIWLKAYLLQRSTHAYSPLSGILYVEIISDSNKLIKRISIPAAYGLAWGQIPLSKEDFSEGNYFIRAYTNWMQNFGDEYFYHQQINIIDPLTVNWLVKENHTIVSSQDQNDVDFTLQLSNNNYLPEKQKAIELKIIKAKKTIFRQDMETTSAGILKANFSLPSNTYAKDISILVQDKTDPNKRSVVPLVFNRPQNIDLQFMPESGYLVEGIGSKVGFKAIAENGLGIDIQGKIVDSKNAEVASFTSLHRDMGIFKFTPAKNETYSAIVNLPGGNTKHFPLPPVKNSGIILQFDNAQNSDSIKLTIKASPDIVANKVYHLIGLSRGVVCYAANIILRNTEISAPVSKKLFPSGIAHFTLMDASGQPVNERMLFIDHSDNLAINILSLKDNFSPRDSIPLHITVADKEGKSVTGSFSISVTDDAQVKTNDLTSENIVTRMLLTGELKGNIEAPDYYTNNTNDNAWQALDALLLTQGWIGYDWQKIFKPSLPLFKAEPQFAVSGKITNILNSPINKAHIVLMSSGSRLNVRDTVTNNKGEFIFTNFKKLDSLSFFLDARNARDKKFGIGITVDEFKPAELKPMTSWNELPWYVNSDSTELNFAHNKQVIETQLFQSGKYKRLQEVKINAKKIIKGSSNLNGMGEADQVIDEAEIVKEGTKSLLQLLKEKVKGFIEIRMGDHDVYKINGDRVVIVIDGLSLRNFGSERETLEALDAQDVTGIEVMRSLRNISRYKNTFLTLGEQLNITSYVDFIEITTRSGNGLFLKKAPGLMLYKPVPIILPMQFYSPKYHVKDDNDKIKDLRSTVYWQPSLVTNKSGEANTYFYAADIPTTYTITIQGSDISGSVGYKVEKIVIK